MALHDKFRYRVGWWGKLILQIQVTENRRLDSDSFYAEPVTFWRDATTEDLTPFTALNPVSSPDGTVHHNLHG